MFTLEDNLFLMWIILIKYNISLLKYSDKGNFANFQYCKILSNVSYIKCVQMKVVENQFNDIFNTDLY